MSWVSSKLKVVWVINDTLSGSFTVRRLTSSTFETSTVASGASPRVPMTSSWSLSPINQIALDCLRPHHRGNAVGDEDNARAGGHLIQFLDENGPGGPEHIDYVLVMDYLLTDIDRSPVEVKGNFYYVDS